MRLEYATFSRARQPEILCPSVYRINLPFDLPAPHKQKSTWQSPRDRPVLACLLHEKAADRAPYDMGGGACSVGA